MTGYSKKGGPKGHHKIRGKSKNMASAIKERPVDKDLRKLRDG